MDDYSYQGARTSEIRAVRSNRGIIVCIKQPTITNAPQSLLFSQIIPGCLISDLLSAKGTTHRVVETDDWRDNLHTKRTSPATALPEGTPLWNRRISHTGSQS